MSLPIVSTVRCDTVDLHFVERETRPGSAHQGERCSFTAPKYYFWTAKRRQSCGIAGRKRRAQRRSQTDGPHRRSPGHESGDGLSPDGANDFYCPAAFLTAHCASTLSPSLNLKVTGIDEPTVSGFLTFSNIT